MFDVERHLLLLYANGIAKFQIFYFYLLLIQLLMGLGAPGASGLLAPNLVVAAQEHACAHVHSHLQPMEEQAVWEMYRNLRNATRYFVHVSHSSNTLISSIFHLYCLPLLYLNWCMMESLVWQKSEVNGDFEKCVIALVRFTWPIFFPETQYHIKLIFSSALCSPSEFVAFNAFINLLFLSASSIFSSCIKITLVFQADNDPRIKISSTSFPIFFQTVLSAAIVCKPFIDRFYIVCILNSCCKKNCTGVVLNLVHRVF